MGYITFRNFVLFFFVWTFFGLLQAARLYFAYNYGDEILVSWGQAIAWALTEWYLWAIFGLLIYKISSRLKIDKRSWPKVVAIHLALSLIIAALHMVAYTFIYMEINQSAVFVTKVGTSLSGFLQTYESLFRGKLHVSLITYYLITFACYTIAYFNNARKAELKVARVEKDLVQAQLEALKVQLQPHFLFNTLNAITAPLHLILIS